MATQTLITVPDQGFEDATIRVGLWRVAKGDPVGPGDPLVELLVPGILHLVTADAWGKIAAVRAASGTHVAVGQTLCELEKGEMTTEF